VPVLPRQDQPRRFAQPVRQLAAGRLGGGVDLALGRPPLGVGPPQLGCDLLGARLVLGQQQLDPGVGPVEPAGGVDPRRQAKGEIALVEPGRLAARRGDQRPQPWTPSSPHLRQTPPHEVPVLPHQRDHVGDGRQGDQVEVGVGVARSVGRAAPP
jgi:hypothetical protein